jgi:hypothetical protein
VKLKSLQCTTLHFKAELSPRGHTGPRMAPAYGWLCHFHFGARASRLVSPFSPIRFQLLDWRATDASSDGPQPGQPLSHGTMSIVVVTFTVPALVCKPPGTSTNSQSHCAPEWQRRGVHHLVHVPGLKSGNWHRQSLNLATASNPPPLCGFLSLSLSLATNCFSSCVQGQATSASFIPCSLSDPAGQRKFSRHPCPAPTLVPC